MKIIAVEEHFVPAELFTAWAKLPEQRRDISYGQSTKTSVRQLLEDMADERLREMDRTGVDKQVLSLTTAGVQSLDDAVPMARRMNDLAAEAVRRRPDRFEAFAALPLGTPEAAVAELRRAICELALLWHVQPDDARWRGRSQCGQRVRCWSNLSSMARRTAGSVG